MTEELARCDQEIARIQREAAENLTHPAYLFALGINDWSVERELLLANKTDTPDPASAEGDDLARGETSSQSKGGF